uniref:Uncharacterized protein n=1 Tax=Chromera velia CCMP2878 TaxID=1169474 RepID=A0A0G4GFU5_9ALVE|eukprot:Cvel_21708.t1-p1 / transcript=Cvel_21708.t1 / gene=Cvel_21708 / organism=Chromera_velia_CCMP2878 / gene_product=hypothetical protein / transcript_product=hypothetical protein / location=Cvel_scaffold2059:9367-12266(-) / protein_length=460 / sequence_SO=supercontig / SO=protein_coding / is_pseudo=false
MKPEWTGEWTELDTSTCSPASGTTETGRPAFLDVRISAPLDSIDALVFQNCFAFSITIKQCVFRPGTEKEEKQEDTQSVKSTEARLRSSATPTEQENGEGDTTANRDVSESLHRAPFSATLAPLQKASRCSERWRTLLSRHTLMQMAHCEADAHQWHVLHASQLTNGKTKGDVSFLRIFILQPSPLWPRVCLMNFTAFRLPNPTSGVSLPLHHRSRRQPASVTSPGSGGGALSLPLSAQSGGGSGGEQERVTSLSQQKSLKGGGEMGGAAQPGSLAALLALADANAQLLTLPPTASHALPTPNSFLLQPETFRSRLASVHSSASSQPYTFDLETRARISTASWTPDIPEEKPNGQRERRPSPPIETLQDIRSLLTPSRRLAPEGKSAGDQLTASVVDFLPAISAGPGGFPEQHRPASSLLSVGGGGSGNGSDRDGESLQIHQPQHPFCLITDVRVVPGEL